MFDQETTHYYIKIGNSGIPIIKCNDHKSAPHYGFFIFGYTIYVCECFLFTSNLRPD